MRVLLPLALTIVAILWLLTQSRTRELPDNSLGPSGPVVRVDADHDDALAEPPDVEVPKSVENSQAPARRIVDLTSDERDESFEPDAVTATFTLRVVTPHGQPAVGIPVIVRVGDGLELNSSRPFDTNAEGEVNVEASITNANTPAPLKTSIPRVIFWARPDRKLGYAQPSSVSVDMNEEALLKLALGSTLDVQLGPLDDRRLPAVRSWLPFGGADDRTLINDHAGVELELLSSDGDAVNTSLKHATSATSVRWEGLTTGTYHLVSRLPGLRQPSPLAILEDLFVPPGGSCQDPRLVGWNPYGDRDLMYLTVLDENGHSPELLTVGLQGQGGRVNSHRPYDGLPITLPVPLSGEGVDATEHFEAVVSAPGSAETVVPIVSGSKTVRLTPSLRVKLSFQSTVRGLPAGMQLWIHSSGGPGKRGRSEATGVLESANGTFEFDASAPGSFIGHAYAPDQTYYNTAHKSLVEPFEFDVVSPPPRSGVQLIDIQLVPAPSK